MAKVLNGDRGLRGQRLVQWGASREGKYTTEAKQVIRTHGHITFPVQIHVQIQGQKRRIERCCEKY